MARQKSSLSAVPVGQLASRTLILDNGAHTIKAGFSSTAAEAKAETDCELIPNCIARSQRDKRTYIGAELDDCDDYGELAFRRPVEKGFAVNWESEKAIWEHSLFDKGARLKCDPRDTNLILTEAPNAPTALQRNADEMVFEEFEFAYYYRTTAPTLNAYATSPFPSTTTSPSGIPLECLLVIDAGHSHTTVTPLYQGCPLHPACRRVEVGGKILTNQLKELISTRQFELRKEDWIAGQLKEDVCYVSQQYNQDLERVWKGGSKDPREVDLSVVVDYVLPDYEAVKRGFSRPHDPSFDARKRRLGIGGPREEVLVLANERFTVPELLFTPSDVVMQQEGVVGTILQSLNALPKGLWQPFLANVLVVGGTSKLPGFVERLEADLRSAVPEEYVIRVAQARDPVKNVWLGGARLAQNEDVLRNSVVSRQEYVENGDIWTRRKFAGKVGR